MQRVRVNIRERSTIAVPTTKETNDRLLSHEAATREQMRKQIESVYPDDSLKRR
jgi:hypothetical protein